ncbi:MAG TPA: ergothioneine biosynthesis protein EgtB [Burkholderiales bacterium]|nr:ergothioneine biosynthesis protein EgtB [Burkholderiales bacterium]
MSNPEPLFSARAQQEEIGARYLRTRARSAQLAAPLSEEDCGAQSMPDASPVKWHLAHTTWFFETFLLKRYEPDFRPFHAAFEALFNSYYNSIGEQFPRPRRGLLTRPGLAEIHAYRRDADQRMQRLLERRGEDAELRALAMLGIHHEQQHQELILTDVKHLLSMNPLQPAYGAPPAAFSSAADPLRWLDCAGGVVEIGHGGSAFCFDNELPRHKHYLQPYRLASRLTTNGEYLEFIAAGGYRDPAHWLSEGWDWVRAQQISAPLYWRDGGDGWHEFTLGGLAPLDPRRPVVHLSYFEADAYAHWRQARLPTEAEWERAAVTCRLDGNFADDNLFHPLPARGRGLAQMFGDVWEWTQSSYAPYPGFRPATGALGEYNGKFMVNQYVLRGGSCATPRDHIRATYRNFFPASARWQFSGIRLARDAA